MSASENLRKLQEQDRQRAIQAEEERKRRDEETNRMAAEKELRYQDLYNSGFFVAATLQNELFDQLRQVGLVDMITDVTKRKFFKPFPPQTKEEREGRLIAKWPTDEGIWEEVFDRSGWQVSVPSPEMSKDGKWKETLKIAAVKTHSDLHRGSMHPKQRDYVLFTYSPTQRLFIDGARRVFNRQLVIPSSPSQTERLEFAVAKAFHQPKIEQVESKRLVWGPDIRLGSIA